LVLVGLAACAPRAYPKNPAGSVPPELIGQLKQPEPAAVVPGAAPHIQIVVAAMPEHTGSEFGLNVPMLQVVLRNVGQQSAEVPPPGLDMLLSLQVVLSTTTTVEFRRVTLDKPWNVAVLPLAPQAELHQSLSPLSRDQRDVPLAPGRYQVGVCVIPDREAAYRSGFTEKFGGTCSNEIELVVRRGK
jgi:hypothetical protein